MTDDGGIRSVSELASRFIIIHILSSGMTISTFAQYQQLMNIPNPQARSSLFVIIPRISPPESRNWTKQ